jgi:hypothetical protein
VRVAIANCSPPVEADLDYEALWAQAELPPPRDHRRLTLFEQQLGWGFHVHALGVHLLDRGIATSVEFWDYNEARRIRRTPAGILWVEFHNEADLAARLAQTGPPDLLVNYGRHGLGALAMLEGQSFRVHVPCLRMGLEDKTNRNAECYLVDGPEWLDERSMLYVPPIHDRRIRPTPGPKPRDFLYFAAAYQGKRHDIAVDAARRTGLTGHFHPVDADALDVAGADITTSGWDGADIAAVLGCADIAVYPGDHTSNPSALWECVAAGMPIVVNSEIAGGKHVVVPGVTGELAAPDEFADAMAHVHANRAGYRAREHHDEHWETERLLADQLAFFERMGFACS